MPMQDETLPAPPAEAVEDMEATLPAGIFDDQDVPDLGEALPKGTFHFRAESYSTIFKEIEGYEGDAQPTFMVRQVCQEEPNLGRSFTDFVDFVTPGLIRDAVSGHPKAASILRQRLPRAKSYMEACGVNPNRGLDFKKDFLDQNPECRIQISVRPRKTRDASGALVATGENTNSAVKYISLSVPVG